VAGLALTDDRDRSVMPALEADHPRHSGEPEVTGPEPMRGPCGWPAFASDHGSWCHIRDRRSTRDRYRAGDRSCARTAARDREINDEQGQCRDRLHAQVAERLQTPTLEEGRDPLMRRPGSLCNSGARITSISGPVDTAHQVRVRLFRRRRGTP
jgi:hypothetical protein